MHTKLGVLYLAFGYDFLVLCTNSARTLRKFSRNIHITLVTNIPIKDVYLDGNKVFDTIVFEELPPELNRHIKVRIIDYASCENNIFLDGDTEVYSSPVAMSNCLDYFDLAMRMMPPATKNRFEAAPGICTSDIAIGEWNTGVIFFRKSAASRELFNQWEREFHALQWRRDQPAFVRAAFKIRNARILPLPAGWNIKPVVDYDLGLMTHRPKEVRILHYRDPILAPDIARNVAKTHRDMQLELVRPSAHVQEGRERFAILCRIYGSRISRVPFGKVLQKRIYKIYMSKSGNRRTNIKINKQTSGSPPLYTRE